MNPLIMTMQGIASGPVIRTSMVDPEINQNFIECLRKEVESLPDDQFKVTIDAGSQQEDVQSNPYQKPWAKLGLQERRSRLMSYYHELVREYDIPDYQAVRLKELLYQGAETLFSGNDYVQYDQYEGKIISIDKLHRNKNGDFTVNQPSRVVHSKIVLPNRKILSKGALTGAVKDGNGPLENYRCLKSY
jgi:hypothetical protein